MRSLTSIRSLLMCSCRGKTYYGNPEVKVPQGWLPRKDMGAEMGIGDWFFKPVMPNAVRYNNPVDDPLYSAHKQVTVSVRNGSRTRYEPDHPIKGVSCLQQVRILRKASLSCTANATQSISTVMLAMAEKTSVLHSNPNLGLYWALTSQKPTACSALFLVL